MQTGRCTLPQESLYFRPNRDLVGAGFSSLTIGISCLGLALNALSLIVFVRVFRTANNRNNFHLFFVFLSACETLLCLVSAGIYALTAAHRKGPIVWHSGDNATRLRFSYSIHLSGPGAAHLLHWCFSAFAFMAVASQFSRNWWVGITALLRCYVATRRRSVQISQLLTLPRVTCLFACKVALALALTLVRSALVNPAAFASVQWHACDTTDWQRRGVLLLQVQSQPNQQLVNLVWTVLSQIIPLVVIIVSSLLLVDSLHDNSMIDSSERNKRITRMVFIFALTFALLECPRAVAFFALKFTTSVNASTASRIFQVTYVMSLTDSIVNVFIYFFNDQHFKRELRCCCVSGGEATNVAGSRSGNASAKRDEEDAVPLKSLADGTGQASATAI